MIVYLSGSPNKAPGNTHFMSVCPAGHLPHEFQGDDWIDNSGDKPRPKTFDLIFEDGQCNVKPDALAKYLLEQKMVQRNRPFFRVYQQ